MKYITDDGKKFNTIEEAQKHEIELDEIKKNKEKKEEERKELGRKIEKAYEDYCTLLKEYVDKYGTYRKHYSSINHRDANSFFKDLDDFFDLDIFN